MNFLQRFRLSWTVARAMGAKSAELPYSQPHQRVSWLEPSFDRLTTDGYNANAAVGACVRALAFAFPEPAPIVLDQNGDRAPGHPLQTLLSRPNDKMSHSELLTFVAVYLAMGGNCYLHKVRGGGPGGQVLELWPYHAGHMSPIPGGREWIAGYTYDPGNGNKIEVDADDIIHLKWPLMDLAQPWLALPPLRQVAREVDTDGELTRMLYAFLVNDAAPRTLINLPPGTNMNETEYQIFMARFMARHAGDMRGAPAVIEGAANISRLGLNVQELDLTALRGVPEARICAAFGVPPEVAMLSVGLAHSTENNLYAADVRFTTRTLVPLWKIVAGEITQDLAPEFTGNVRVEYDTSKIQALQENETEVYGRVLNAWDRDLITKNEGRSMIGLVSVGELVRDDPGDVFKSETRPPPMPQPIIDVAPVPAQLTDDTKARTVAFKSRDDRTSGIEREMRRAVEGYFEDERDKVMGAL